MSDIIQADVDRINREFEQEIARLDKLQIVEIKNTTPKRLRENARIMYAARTARPYKPRKRSLLGNAGSDVFDTSIGSLENLAENELNRMVVN